MKLLLLCLGLALASADLAPIHRSNALVVPDSYLIKLTVRDESLDSPGVVFLPVVLILVSLVPKDEWQ